jgi:hypothetical protein
MYCVVVVVVGIHIHTCYTPGILKLVRPRMFVVKSFNSHATMEIKDEGHTMLHVMTS